MTAAEYKVTRTRLGTQAEVAALLGVARGTVARRETAALPITTEAALALDALESENAKARELLGGDNAATCEKCAGCQHRNHGEPGAWCYMFQDAPEDLPCSQHDKFEPLRKAMGKNTRAIAFITGAFGLGPTRQ